MALLVAAAVVAGGRLAAGAEDADEVGVVAEAGLLRDVGDAAVGRLQELLRRREADAREELERRAAERLPEAPAEVRLGHVRELRAVGD